MRALAHRLKGPIARGAAGTFALRVFHTGLRFLISLALARMLGATGYGAYSFALACLGVLSVPALLGFDGLLLREVAGYRARDQWALLHGLLRRAGQATRLASLGLAGAGAGVAWALSSHLERPMVSAFWVAVLALPFLTEVRLRQALMTGLHRVVVAQVPETAVQPVLFLALIGAAAVLPSGPPEAPVVVGLYGVSVVVAFAAALALVRRVQARLIRRAAPEYATRTWMPSALRFALTAGLNILGASLGVLMLGPMTGAQATGVFGVATAAAALVALPLMAINAPLAPAVSAAFSAGNTAEIQRLATRAARSAFVTCLPLALAYVVVGEWVLSLFGPEFTAGYAALVILTVGQVINAGAGSVGVLLQMTGHERDVAVVRAGAVALNAALNLALIPDLGPSGAALGAATGMVFWNACLALLVYRRLGIRCTIFAQSHRPAVP